MYVFLLALASVFLFILAIAIGRAEFIIASIVVAVGALATAMGMQFFGDVQSRKEKWPSIAGTYISLILIVVFALALFLPWRTG